MADFGLTLPDHDLTAQEFKELARRIGRAAFVPLFLKFYERVITSEASVEEQRKALADISRWTGVEEDRKVDPNANLPVFNIVFGAPAAGKPSLEAVEIVQPVPQAGLHPAPIADEDLPVFEGLAASKAFRDLAHAAMSPPTEVQDAQPNDAAPQDADSGHQQGRRRRQSAHIDAEAVRAGLSAPAQAPAVQAGAPAQQPHAPPQETIAPADPFAAALADLDAALGL